MKRTNVGGAIGMALAAALIGSELQAANLGTAFTYQGQLKQSGAAYTGTADMIFTLWDGVAPGVQVGPVLTFDGAGGNPAPVAVSGGLFKVELDFGSSVFTGSERYLDIQVRVPAGVGAYVALTPRQRLTAAPYALYALNTANGNTLDQAYNQGGPGAGRTINANNGAVQINGTGGLAVGTYFNVQPALSFVGVNRTSRVTAQEYFGINAPVSSGFGGMYINTTGANGQPFYGYATAGSGKCYHYYEGSTDSWRLYLNGIKLLVDTDGNVGIGDTTPTEGRLVVRTDTANGIEAVTTAGSSYGVHGTGTSAGVYGQSGASDGAGVLGRNQTPTGTGVEGSSGAQGAAGVAGYANFGTGVYGQTSDGYGVYGSNGGSNSSGYAAYFNGRVHVNGNLSKNGGSFKIDHPLDPQNKFLSHSFVESPERMNVYNGNVVLDAEGKGTVTLPSWFQALNKDFRYQLTAIGGPGPNLYVAKEIENNSFAIAGGSAGLKVSWQVTGVRHDAWAVANPLPVEEVKPATERGTYLNPEAFGIEPAKSSDLNIRNGRVAKGQAIQ